MSVSEALLSSWRPSPHALEIIIEVVGLRSEPGWKTETIYPHKWPILLRSGARVCPVPVCPPTKQIIGPVSLILLVELSV